MAGVGAGTGQGTVGKLISRGRDDSIRLMIQLYLFINDEHHSETLATWLLSVDICRYIYVDICRYINGEYLLHCVTGVTITHERTQ